MQPKHISPSQIGTFLTCPLQYKYSYLDGLPKPPPNIYMIYGSAFHAALEFNYQQKIKSRKDLPSSEVISKFDEVFERELKKHNIFNNKIRNDMFISARNSIVWYMTNESYKIQPKLVEEVFEIKLTNFPITIKGIMDLVTEDDIIVDYKTAGLNWRSQYKNLSNNVQLIMYAVAFRKLFDRKEKGIEFNIFPRNDEVMYRRGTMFDEETILRWLNNATNIDKIIKLGVFIPNYNSCSQCFYKNTCPKQVIVDQKT